MMPIVVAVCDFFTVVLFFEMFSIGDVCAKTLDSISISQQGHINKEN